MSKPDLSEYAVMCLRREVSEYDWSDKESIQAPPQFIRSLISRLGTKVYSGFTVWDMEGKLFRFDRDGWLSIEVEKKRVRRAALPERMRKPVDKT